MPRKLILNSGTNSVDMTGSSDFVNLYGGAGNDTLKTSAGGGYLIGEGGTNHDIGGGGPNVFIGGGGTDDMHGGTGVNTFYVGANDTVAGAGTYNTLVELAQGVTLVLGSANMTNVQTVILNGGANTIDASSATSQLFIYGGAGNDTIGGGAGNDYLWGSAGTNTFVEHAGFGQDEIVDWAAGTNNNVTFKIAGVTGFAQITQTIVNGSDVVTVIGDTADHLTIYGVGAALSTASFHFSGRDKGYRQFQRGRLDRSKSTKTNLVFKSPDTITLNSTDFASARLPKVGGVSTCQTGWCSAAPNTAPSMVRLLHGWPSNEHLRSEPPRPRQVLQNAEISLKCLERAIGIEPTTFSLGS